MERTREIYLRIRSPIACGLISGLDFRDARSELNVLRASYFRSKVSQLLKHLWRASSSMRLNPGFWN